MKKKSIIFTKHAEEMLVEREFPKELIEDIVTKPEWTEASDEDIWYAFKRIREKVLRVVVNGKNPSIVLTMYFDRRIK